MDVGLPQSGPFGLHLPSRSSEPPYGQACDGNFANFEASEFINPIREHRRLSAQESRVFQRNQLSQADPGLTHGIAQL